MMLDSQGGTFPCHKTAKGEHDDSGEYHETGDEIHCAGALIFAEKNGNATQMMRISERFGEYDHTALTAESKGLVWDNLRQWLKGGTGVKRTAKAKKGGAV